MLLQYDNFLFSKQKNQQIIDKMEHLCGYI